MAARTEADRKPLVLVVDDEAAARLLTAEALEQGGFAVVEIGDGRLAIERFSELRPDLVLLDVVMPGMDGFQVCAALRRLPQGRNLPVVMVTGLEDLESIERAYRAGATDFITKPINWPILRHRVHYILRASQSLEAFARSEERYALAARGANDGLWDWDLEAGRVYYSPRWVEMLGYRERDVGSGPEDWLERLHRDDAERVRTEIAAHLAGDTPHFESEYRMRARDGNYRWVLCRGLAVRDGAGRPYRMAGSQTDVTARKQAEQQLLFDAVHDSLTHLPNRTLFLDRVEHCIGLARRHPNYRFAVVFLDLDRFKNINDSLGHALGDRLLKDVGRRIQRFLRTTDTLARFGGDEFTILFEDLPDLAALTRAVERIQHELRLPFDLDGHQVVITASMGITLSTTGYERPEDMLRDADTAMYRAKALGKARYEVFDTEMHAEVLRVLQLEEELRSAASRGEFRLHYQPIIGLDGGQVVGFEALLRWQHPQRGLLRPEAFLGIADEIGLLPAVGHWALNEACRQMRAWQELSPRYADCYVSINLSSREFAQPDLVERVQSALGASGLRPQCLKIEVTENALLENTPTAMRVLTALKTVGVQLSIDDFGTGYSSFNTLHRFPFDVLKIDRDFVRRLGDGQHTTDIVQAIVVLAHSLGLTVVAEGSESLASLQLLKGLHCEQVQGFVFSEPVDPARLSELIAADSDRLNTPRDYRAPVAAGTPEAP